MKNALINGDSLNILKKFPDNSFDSMVTDPPAGISFMGKKWDKDKGGREQWIAWLESIMTEAFRTLKPGAHILVWAIPRTSHWTATAVENAGFEIKDVVTHIFGSGFPKNHSIGKAIDREQGVKREVVGKKEMKGRLAELSKFQPNKDGYPKKPRPKDNYWTGEILGGPVTDDAKQWEGWGTALKPASEHWILARKAVSEKTIAANVLEHGTGGINIDASRIALNGDYKSKSNGRPSLTGLGDNYNPDEANKPDTVGRFPANLILSHKPGCKQKCDDDCAIKEINEQSLAGGMHSAGGKRKGGESKQSGEGGLMGVGNHEGNGVRFGDEGGASRFFYCAKASKKEKTLNKTINNKHPTVKPLKLMKYLIKMITPPGGIVLDPFMGSGTTGQAAIEENFGFVGVELEINSYDIAKKRIPSIDNLICTENA